MRFRVGPWVYRVRCVELDDRAGQVDFDRHEILIDDRQRLQARLATLIHELRHAWDRELGRPQWDEDRCNNAASFTADVMRQLAMQGGVAALARMGTPLDVPMTNIGAECAACGTRYAPHQIHAEPPRFDDAADCLAVDRWLDCEFCGHIQRWTETATVTGSPSGRVVVGPTFHRSIPASSPHPLPQFASDQQIAVRGPDR